MSVALFVLFIISYFLHLTSRMPVLATIRFDLVFGIVVLLVGFFSLGDKDERYQLNVTKRLLLFAGYILFSLPMVTWPGSVLRFYLVDWLKVALFLFLFLLIVRRRRDLFLVVAAFVGCQLYRIFEPLYLHLADGYWGDVAYSSNAGFQALNRLAGAPHDIVNANQFAWVIVTTIPFVFYLLGYASNLYRILAIMLLAPMSYALLLTGSRSGLLCLVFTFMAIAWVSHNRKKAFGILFLAMIPATIIAASSMSGDMTERYLSLIDSQAAGADTAKGRIDASIEQIGSISNNPLFGNGLGTSGETNHNILGGSSQITHNLYIEVIQETGLVGFAIFIAMIMAMLKALKQAQANLGSQGLTRKDLLYRLILATRVWIYMDLFYSLSCFGLRSWEWYFFGGVSVCCLVLSQPPQDQVEKVRRRRVVAHVR